MSSLLALIISIILASAMTTASVYYGGISFTKASQSVEITELLSATQQIKAAVDLAEINGTFLAQQGITDIDKLKEKGFLREVPKFRGSNFILDVPNSMIKVKESPSINEETCRQIIARNKNISITLVTTIPTVPEDNVKYGCLIDNITTKTYTYYSKF